jgi:hypothetical protein
LRIPNEWRHVDGWRLRWDQFDLVVIDNMGIEVGCWQPGDKFLEVFRSEHGTSLPLEVLQEALNWIAELSEEVVADD